MFNLLRDTPLGQQLLQEAELRGELQGELRGRVEGLHRALVRALTHRFGNLPETLLTTLQGIDDPERLEQLLDVVLDAPDLKSFQAQL